MKVHDVIRMAFQNIVRLKFKSILSIVSVAIGVAAVYMILSLSTFGEQTVKQELDRLGIDGLTLYKQSNTGVKIDLHYADTLKETFPFVEETMPLVAIYGNIAVKGEESKALLFGAGDQLEDVMGLTLLHGRLFLKQDITHSRNVAVIDRELANATYKRDNVVGKKIRITIGNYVNEFEIIGIVEKQASLLDGISGGRFPEIIYIPFTTANDMNHTENADQIAIRCIESMDTAEAAAMITEEFNKNEEEPIYFVENINGYIRQIKKLVTMLSVLLTVIAGISLFVAGIGVMNRMLSSVVERNKEIGIWIALGAKEKDIFRILLTESILICMIGGCTGGLVGYGLINMMQLFLPFDHIGELKLLLLPLLFAFCIGIGFGVIPSKKAAKMHPVDLLREN